MANLRQHLLALHQLVRGSDLLLIEVCLLEVLDLFSHRLCLLYLKLDLYLKLTILHLQFSSFFSLVRKGLQPCLILAVAIQEAESFLNELVIFAAEIPLYFASFLLVLQSYRPVHFSQLFFDLL